MKNIKIFVCLLLVLCSCVTFCGCEEESGDYPVTIGNITFEKSPKSIAVISPNLADIIDCIGYNDKVSLVSDEVITESFTDLPSCGTSIAPDTEEIISSGVTAVIADDNLSDGAIKEMESKGIKVVQFHYGNDGSEIKTTYKSVGAILGGADGRKKGEDAYDKLTEDMKIYRDAVNTNCKSLRLLYLSGTGPYVTAVAGSWYNTVLNYTGVKVVSDTVDTPSVTLTNIIEFNADYLVYDSNTLKDLQAKDSLKSARFLKQGNSREIPKDRLKLQGSTVLTNIKEIISMYDKEAVENAEKSLEATIDKTEIETTKEAGSEKTTEKVTASSHKNTSTTINSTTSSTEPSTIVAKIKKSEYELQSKYGVNFTSSAIETMVKQKENKYIKAMQERLSALGYIDKKYITGYFGDLTEKAIKDFENNNSLSDDGVVTSKMLKKLFSSKAKKK